MNPDQREWTEREIQILREEWALGLSASTIGRRLGRSTNSVIGKVHRLDLPGRPSPIRSGKRLGLASPGAEGTR